jgi:peroxiredoxin Q/BCP
MILGASVDPLEAQKKFHLKFNVNFPLLCDVTKGMSRQYGVLNERGIDRRVTFIIDPEGKIRHVFPMVRPEGHTREVMEIIKTLN